MEENKVFDDQMEYVNSYFGYSIYKVLRGNSLKYFVGGYLQEFDNLDGALRHAQFLMEKNL